MKTCTICGLTPPKDPYKGNDGRCRECHKNAVKKWKAENPQNVRDVISRWRSENHEKEKAHKSVAKALKSGKIKVSEECADCGLRGVKLDGHHEDYTKRLEVVWLCRCCHMRRHGRGG